jgi:hypothetical protein
MVFHYLFYIPFFQSYYFVHFDRFSCDCTGQLLNDKRVKATNSVSSFRDTLNLRNQDSHSYTTAAKDTDFCENLEIYLSYFASIFMLLDSTLDEKWSVINSSWRFPNSLWVFSLCQLWILNAVPKLLNVARFWKKWINIFVMGVQGNVVRFRSKVKRYLSSGKRPARPTQPHIQWEPAIGPARAKWLGREADHSTSI